MYKTQLDSLKKMLMSDEGVAFKPYRCTSSKLTIGVGRNLDDQGLNHREISLLLEDDINYHLTQLSKNFSWFEYLDNVRQNALVNMSFNLGFKGLCNFKKMLNAFAEKDYDTAARECLDSKYGRGATEKRAARVAYLIKTGKQPKDWYNDFQVIK